MGKKIAVILGAGASSDLISPRQSNAILNEEYRPPRADGLFSLHRNLEPILQHYLRAYTAIGSMRNRFGREGTTLEGMLRELKESNEESKIQQFKQIPLYLQHLFGEICTHFCRHPMNYATLISDTNRSDIPEVAYITLNYDLFLEMALSREYGIPFANMDQYTPDAQKWIYIKLHGSINWGRKIKSVTIKNPNGGLDALLHNIAWINFETDLEEDIQIDDSYKSPPNHTNDMYPAMTVPVDNKYEFSCPNTHVERLKTFLKDCKHFLIIGVSGKDRDLLDLLRQNIAEAASVTLVGGKHIEETQERFKDAIPQFNTGLTGWRKYDNGFSNFIIADGVDRFLE